MKFEIPPQKENWNSPEIFGPGSDRPEADLPSERGDANQKLKKAFSKNPRLPDFSEDIGFHRGPRRRFRGRKTLVWSFAAALIDTLLFLAYAMGLAWLGLRITGVDFYVAGTSLTIREWALLGLVFFASFSFCYLVLCRLFLKATIGEWACGLEISTGSFFKKNYVTQILLRCLLVCLSGYFLFPLISLVVGKDLVGLATGTQIQET
jgi:hypothetical protein